MSAIKGKLLLSMFILGAEGFVVPSTNRGQGPQPLAKAMLKGNGGEGDVGFLQSIKQKGINLKNKVGDYINGLLGRGVAEEDDYLPELRSDIFHNFDIVNRKHTKEYYVYKDDEQNPDVGAGEHIKIPDSFLYKLMDERKETKIKSVSELIKQIEGKKEQKPKSFVDRLQERIEDPLSLGDDWISLDDDCMRL